jgi:toxin ParE1/3/4
LPQVRISTEAEDDIDRIVTYTISEWGWRQAHRYLTKLEEGFDLLARSPSIGRSCDSIRTGLRRYEIGKHVLFYLPESEGVLIVRVLHERMLPNRYL